MFGLRPSEGRLRPAADTVLWVLAAVEHPGVSGLCRALDQLPGLQVAVAVGDGVTAPDTGLRLIPDPLSELTVSGEAVAEVFCTS